MSEVYPHEAWCPHCHVSHTPGTKRCLHCGGRVMPARPAGGSVAPAQIAAPIDGPRAPDLFAEEADDEQAAASRVARPFRIGVATLWIALAVIGALLRTCAERG